MSKWLGVPRSLLALGIFLPSTFCLFPIRERVPECCLHLHFGWLGRLNSFPCIEINLELFLCEMPTWDTCPVICWDLILRHSSWALGKTPSLWSRQSLPFSFFPLCRSFKLLYLLICRSVLPFLTLLQTLGSYRSLPAIRLVVKSAFLLDFLWLIFFFFTSTNPHVVHFTVRFEMFSQVVPRG